MRRIVDLVLSCIGTALIIAAVFLIGPELETRFWPVYSKFKVQTVEEQPDGTSKVTFEYTKHRWCEPLGFSWFVGEPGAAFRQLRVVPADPDESTMVRPLGRNKSVPYIIDATPSQLEGRVYGEIFNRCHPAWSSRTAIYP